MNFFGGDDHMSNPFEVISKWIEHAHEIGESDAEAMDIATVDHSGMPNVRIVYARQIEDNGVVFYTNYNGRKGIELENGKGAANFFFKKEQRQLRLRGVVEKVSTAQSDAYFASRAEGSRLGAWVSQQSQPLESREKMMAEWDAMPKDKAGQRPPHWGGYRLIPNEIEFWAMGEFRLHDRFRWTRSDLAVQNWKVERLYP